MKKFLFILFVFLVQFSSATTWYAIKDGDWNNDNTWDDGGFWGWFAQKGHPVDGDIAVIKNGYTITVGSDAACDSLYMYNLGNNTLTINSSKELTIKNGIYVNGYSDSHSNYIKVYGTLTITNRNIYIKRYDDGWYDIQLLANNGTIDVNGDIIYEYIDGPEWESYKEFDFQGTSNISCTNFTITKTDDYDEGLVEIYLANSAQLNVSNNFSVTEEKGDGYKLVMENSSQINIDNNSTVDITATSGGKDLSITLSGTSAYRVGTDDGSTYESSILLNSGNELSLKLADDATYTVYGNQSFEHSGNEDFLLLLNDGTNGSSNDAQLDIKNDLSITLTTIRNAHIYTYYNADIKIGGDFSVTQNDFVSTSADFVFDLNNESGITVGGNSDIDFTATGSNNDLNIYIDNDAFWNTTGNINWAYDGDNDFLIYLNQNADGSSADAQLTSNGNISFTGQNSLRSFYLKLNNNADLQANGTLDITLSGNGDWENNGITLANDAKITSGGSSSITHTSTNKSSLNINLYNNAAWTIGTSGHTTDNFTVNYNAVYKMFFKLYDNSALTVYGDFTLDRQNGDAGQNCEFNTYTTSHITIYDDLILKNTQDLKLMKLTLTDNAILTVKDDIDFSNAPSDQRLQIETWSSSKLYIAGNFIRNASKYGTLSCNETSTLYYNGTGQQQEIAANAGSGSDSFTYANVVLNNTTASTPQFTMEGTSEIRDGYDLKFTDGIVLADATHYFKILDNATVSDASSASFVDGYIHKIGNDAFTFPIGNSVYYAPASISAPSNTSDEFSGRYRFEDPDNAGDRTKKDASLHHISHQEYWNIDRVAGSSNINLTLTWAEPRTGGIDDVSEIRLAHWNNTTWEDFGNNSTTGDTASGSITVNSVSSFSPFTLASINRDNPLPVELITFEAQANNNMVDLLWTTASEINNDYFVIESSSDGIEFNEVTEIVGAGNSNVEINYSAIDYNPYNGISYYRLKQVDFDGTMAYSKIRMVNFNNTSDKNIEMAIYPNPARPNTSITISLSEITEQTVLSIHTVSGQVIISNYPVTDKYTKLDGDLFKPGIYVISIQDRDTSINQKLIVK